MYPVINQLNTTLTYNSVAEENEQNRQIRETVRRERPRLLDFIRKRLPDPDEAEDILQDVFMELTEAYRLLKPIERVAAWLFTVARNKINDVYRRGKNKTVSLSEPTFGGDSDADEMPLLADWLTDTGDDSPESALFRETFYEALTEALAQLPAEQRDVFIRHEVDGQSFKAMSAELGVSVNTLLSRKRYAVLHLREQLQELYTMFK